MHTATKHDQKSINTNAGAHSQQKQGRRRLPSEIRQTTKKNLPEKSPLEVRHTYVRRA